MKQIEIIEVDTSSSLDKYIQDIEKASSIKGEIIDDLYDKLRSKNKQIEITNIITSILIIILIYLLIF